MLDLKKSVFKSCIIHYGPIMISSLTSSNTKIQIHAKIFTLLKHFILLINIYIHIFLDLSSTPVAESYSYSYQAFLGKLQSCPNTSCMHRGALYYLLLRSYKKVKRYMSIAKESQCFIPLATGIYGWSVNFSCSATCHTLEYHVKYFYIAKGKWGGGGLGVAPKSDASYLISPIGFNDDDHLRHLKRINGETG